jgi:hypothetical protein
MDSQFILEWWHHNMHRSTLTDITLKAMPGCLDTLPAQWLGAKEGEMAQLYSK